MLNFNLQDLLVLGGIILLLWFILSSKSTKSSKSSKSSKSTKSNQENFDWTSYQKTNLNANCYNMGNSLVTTPNGGFSYLNSGQKITYNNQTYDAGNGTKTCKTFCQEMPDCKSFLFDKGNNTCTFKTNAETSKMSTSNTDNYDNYILWVK